MTVDPKTGKMGMREWLAIPKKESPERSIGPELKEDKKPNGSGNTSDENLQAGGGSVELGMQKQIQSEHPRKHHGRQDTTDRSWKLNRKTKYRTNKKGEEANL